MTIINYKKITPPEKDNSGVPVKLSNKTISERHKKILRLMEKHDYSSLVIYADKEHGSNFEYLVGYIPRFEEGLLVLNKDGSITLVLGNENFNKVDKARIEAHGIKCTLFSLANQPMSDLDELDEVFSELNLDTEKNVGLVGWKLIPNMTKNYDLPEFIVQSLKNHVDEDKLFNATGIFIDPAYGARITNNANEIAHYEYGSSLSSDSVLDALNHLKIGKTELEIGNLLTRDGQTNNVVTISAFGERFIDGNVYPTNRELKLGDKVALTTSYRGGLSSRTGYAVNSLEELQSIDKGYFEDVVLPYFGAYYYWLRNIKIGKNGGEFYREFRESYPQSKYGWELNPGHLTANEEWMSSPFYENSDAKVQSGMIFQVDFIPIQPPHQGVSAESTVAIADESLCHDIKEQYPDLWNRIIKRKKYMQTELNIELSPEILPLTSTVGYYRPFMLNKEFALYFGKY